MGKGIIQRLTNSLSFNEATSSGLGGDEGGGGGGGSITETSSTADLKVKLFL